MYLSSMLGNVSGMRTAVRKQAALDILMAPVMSSACMPMKKILQDMQRLQQLGLLSLSHSNAEPVLADWRSNPSVNANLRPAVKVLCLIPMHLKSHERHKSNERSCRPDAETGLMTVGR